MDEHANPLAFGKHHATCNGCGELFGNSELEDGKCFSCAVREDDRRSLILAQADGKTLAKLAREITASIKSNTKNEAISPDILDAALNRLGGKQALGELIASETLKATGVGLNAIEKSMWRYSPLVVHRWAELLVRLSTKVDERLQLDVSTLSEDDLISSLTTLVMDMINNNAEYRRMALIAAIRAEPSLIHEAMTEAGMPVVNSTSSLPKIQDHPEVEDMSDFNEEAVADDDE